MRKLTPAELETYKKKLLTLRSRIRGVVSTLSKSTIASDTDFEAGRSSSSFHSADLGADSFDQEFSMSLMETGSGRVQEIDDALSRIEDGTYGVCENCGSRIPKARLEALPYAAVCIKCATGTKASGTRARRS
ncbi:MAG: TraR/DksA C4-type zinc finger protein [Planctomycetia bacterium]|nr:TraR/DksA C4-type zinc finger protein [Planctomycetia bacterium]